MRRLPRAQNPLLASDQTPKHETLVARRRLGQTDLKLTSGAGQADFAGIFDYAHLRVSLPHDLQKSGIFSAMKNGLYPESYFLMRRSKDGYISATGMYKAAFPWSSLEEEQAERRHHKTLPSGNGEEVAGNVWISPEDSLSLADDYNIRAWIIALLDPAPIEIGPKDKITGEISSPPKFVVPKSDKDNLLLPPDMASGTPHRSRAKRSASPTKAGAAPPSPRKIASPKKRANRATSAKAEDKTEKTSKALQDKLENGVAPAVNGTKEAGEVRVAAQETVENKDDTKIVKTSVTVSMPASHPDLPIPKNLGGVIEKAKGMIEEANKHEAAKSSSSKKRKASTSLTKETQLEEKAEPSKKQKTGLEERLMTERVRTRALVGLTATLAIGAIIPYFL